MTTTIFTSLIGPFCEMFYKYKTSLGIQSAEINTYRNYGFSTSFSLNFGFELYAPFDINNIYLQPGVFTYQDAYFAYPNVNNGITKFLVQNNIVLQDLPSIGVSSINYQSKTLPIVVSIFDNGPSILGIASNYITNGIPYDNRIDSNTNIRRQFESDLVSNAVLSILIFVNLEDATFTGTNSNWQCATSSLYNIDKYSYRFNNGYGQFYSSLANNTFLGKNINVNVGLLNELYRSTYSMVYNWANNLSWGIGFTAWYASNKNIVDPFTQKFLSDYFGVS